MSTPAQIAANIENAKSSTGPRTDEGRAISSKNSVTLGLFSGDFIRPGEERDYAVMSEALNRDLAPVGILEEVLVEEIHRAMWRLRRCGQVESRLVVRMDDGERYIYDPMEVTSPTFEKIQKSVDRARSQAHRLLHKSTAELRKLQTERQFANEFPRNAEHDGRGLAEWSKIAKAPLAQRTQSEPAAVPRNAQCPCGSGQKHKRCCGKDAPAVLQAA